MEPLSHKAQHLSLKAFAMLVLFVDCTATETDISGEEHTFNPLTIKLRRQLIPLHVSGGAVQHKSAYHGNIAVGGPNSQHFEVVFDTGSGHLVLPSTLCKSSTCMAHKRYRRKASLLAQDIDVDGTPVYPGQARDQITVSFGTGEVTGIFVRDLVCLDGKATQDAVSANSLLQVNMPKQVARTTANLTEDSEEAIEPPANKNPPGCVDLRIVSATEMTEDPFASFAFDGVFGLGLPFLSQTTEFNFLHSAASAGAWHAAPGHENTFSVFLAVSENEESEISFGGWKPDKIADGHHMKWNTLKDSEYGYWQVDVHAIYADGKRVPFCDEGCRAVVDTGTSLLGVPSALGPELVDLLRYRMNKELGCKGAGPRLEIMLDNFTIALDPADYSRPEQVVATEEDIGMAETNAAAADEPESSQTQEADLQLLNEIGPVEQDAALSEAVQGNVTEEAAEAAAQAEEAAQEDLEDTCVPMLMHIDLPSPLFPKTLILGEPILQRYYTAFDSNALRVGFAPAKHL